MTSTQPLAAEDRLDARVLKVAGVVVLGAIMSILDITVVSVALPTFQDVFDATYATVAWTMTAYTLALATVIPSTRRVGALIARQVSRSSAARSCANMAIRFPAMVKPATGPSILPSTIRRPAAPRL